MAAAIVLVVWSVDPLVKLFPDALPPAGAAARIALHAAANEYESAQLGLRAGTDVARLAVRASDLVQVDGPGRIPAGEVRCRFVGAIPIEHNTVATPDDELICRAPAEVPDVLLEQEHLPLPANRSQAVWITVYVPEGTPAGVYEGTVAVDADGQATAVPLSLEVFDFAVPRERHLYVTNWFSLGNLARSADAQPGDEDYFRMLGVYAANMAAHRQNVFWVPWSLVQVTRKSNGSLSFDYSWFDRYVEVFLDAGVDGRIEIQSVGHHGESGPLGRQVELNIVTARDAATGERVELPPEEGLGLLLADLQRHLKKRGWLERAMIHVCDEPYLDNLASWREASAFVHRHAPRIRRIEAIETRDFTGALEVWVPKLSHLRNWYPDFDRARAEGNELWYYICCHPTGRYMNRFLDYALIKTRLLHWINARYDLAGYLHWGFNFWEGDPYSAPEPGLPPGDRNIVYPGPEEDRFSLRDSLRWETQRDSLEDYEYLWLLAQRMTEVRNRLGRAAAAYDPAARGREYAGRLVRSFEDYEREPARFHTVRLELARELEQTLREPLVLWETAPTQDLPVLPAPTHLEVAGVTRPGATVSVNDATVAVGADGRFQHRLMFAQDVFDIRLTVQSGEGTKQQVRRLEP